MSSFVVSDDDSDSRDFSLSDDTACMQNVVILGSRTAGTTMALKAENGTAALVFTIPQSYGTMLFSSPNIGTGTRYTIYTGGEASADSALAA